MALRLSERQVRMLQAMGVAWLPLASHEAEFIWVAIAQGPLTTSEHNLLESVSESIARHLQTRVQTVFLLNDSSDSPALSWTLRSLAVWGEFRLGFLVFGADAEERLLASSHLAGEVWFAEGCTFVSVEPLSILGTSATGKRRLWRLICEIPKRDTPSMTFPLANP